MLMHVHYKGVEGVSESSGNLWADNVRKGVDYCEHFGWEVGFGFADYFRRDRVASFDKRAYYRAYSVGVPTVYYCSTDGIFETCAD